MSLYSIWVLEYAYTNVFPKTGVLYGGIIRDLSSLPIATR